MRSLRKNEHTRLPSILTIHYSTENGLICSYQLHTLERFILVISVPRIELFLPKHSFQTERKELSHRGQKASLIYVIFRCKSVKRTFALFGHKRIFARERGRRTNNVVQLEKERKKCVRYGSNVKQEKVSKRKC